MSVHPDISAKPWTKFFYFVLLAGLLSIEFRAIKKDHEESDARQKKFFESQQAGFGQISSQATTNFKVTTDGLTSAINGLNGVLLETQSVAKTATASLNNVTGGKSFAHITPQTGFKPLPFSIYNEVGITERKPVPTLAEFIENRFTPWARSTFEKASPKTWTGWYRTQLANISSYQPLVSRKLDSITSEHAADYAAHLQTKGWQPSSVNSSLRVLAVPCVSQWSGASLQPHRRSSYYAENTTESA
jgi:hypothetical protein